ncbi:MAG: hypothetical protein QM765_41040 [Myxococcales bacterium]
MMKQLAFVFAAALLASACATSGATTGSTTHAEKAPPSWWHSSVTVENHSDYAVHHLYFTPANALAWGPDQLGTDVLFPHEKATLAGLECEAYDLKMIDEQGDECIVEDIDLCLEAAVWSLDNDDLARCTGFHK